MGGPVILVGGWEHRDGWEPIGRHLMEQVGCVRTRVTLVPLASSRAKQPAEVGRGSQCWNALGADVEVADRRGPGGLERALDALEAPDIVILTGGVPGRLHAALAATPMWERIVDLWHDGTTVVGSSAGAMELCEWRLGVRLPPLVAGLGLIAGGVVVPHFDRYRFRQLADSVVRTLGGLPIVGIDERTALVYRDGACLVVGQGAVTLVRTGRVVRHLPGGEFVVTSLRHGPAQPAPGTPPARYPGLSTVPRSAMDLGVGPSFPPRSVPAS